MYWILCKIIIIITNEQSAKYNVLFIKGFYIGIYSRVRGEKISPLFGGWNFLKYNSGYKLLQEKKKKRLVSKNMIYILQRKGIKM